MNQWNQLADTFGCAWDGNIIPDCAADNICVAWPSILKCIEKEIPESNGYKALDFGCGGGLFCKKLSQHGFNVTGYDQSTELVNSAKCNTPSDVSVTSSNSVMVENGGYDLISSIMVLQFIDDIAPVIDSILSVLNPKGLIVFAVFNPKFIEDNSNSSVFSGFESYRSGYMELKEGIKIPVYNRSESEYREIFESRGLEEVYLDHPIFTKEFLSEYEMPFSTTYSEYQIQGFRHKST